MLVADEIGQTNPDGLRAWVASSMMIFHTDRTRRGQWRLGLVTSAFDDGLGDLTACVPAWCSPRRLRRQRDRRHVDGDRVGRNIIGLCDARKETPYGIGFNLTGILISLPSRRMVSTHSFPAKAYCWTLPS